jgi:thymidylate kinase
MKYLIILRGPAGAGKTTICKYLMEKLGKDKTYPLDLDITLDRENEFKKSLDDALGYKNVIGMMFSGLDHTGNPQQWIGKFKDNGYTILSVILYASLDTYTQRVQNRGYDYKDPNEMKFLFDEFEKIRTIFVDRANIPEITVDTEGKTEHAVVEEILRHLNY